MYTHYLLKKEIQFRYCEFYVFMCVHLCVGESASEGPIRIQEPQVPSYIISHQSCVLHHIMRVVIWLLYCRAWSLTTTPD